MSPARGAELILAGAATYSNEEVTRIITALASTEGEHRAEGSAMPVASLGTFSLRKLDDSWAGILILGALEYYKGVKVNAFQVVPDEDHWTIDIPDLPRPRSPESQPVWRWLSEPWEYAVSDSSVAVTNLDALRGKTVTEAARWGVDGWELFAGAGRDAPRDDIRQVPLGTLLAVDPSLAAVTTLAVGKGLWRDPADLTWRNWG